MRACGIANGIRDQEVDDALIKMMKEKGTFSGSTLMREEGVVAYAEPPAFLDDPFFGVVADQSVIRVLRVFCFMRAATPSSQASQEGNPTPDPDRAALRDERFNGHPE